MAALMVGAGLSFVAGAQQSASPTLPPTTVGAEWVSASIAPDVVFLSLAALPLAPQWRPGDPIREIPRRVFGDAVTQPIAIAQPDPADPLAALQRNQHRVLVPDTFLTPTINIAGANFSAVSPPDPTGDIGTTHYVQAANAAGGSQFRIYDKAGNLVAGPIAMDSLAAGTPCASGLGDPVVLFDEAAGRWLFTEFTQVGNALCFYISELADPTLAQTWTRYAFTAPNFPDYPKYGVWPDAYYVGSNENGNVPMYAFDRQRMLAGLPMSVQRFTAAPLAGFSFQVLQPADLDGADAPPPGAPGVFIRHRDDEVHNSGSNQPTRDFLELFEVRVDWATPANSTLTGPVQIPITEFSSDLNGLATFNVFPQPSGQRIDSLREPVMFRLAYRSFGVFEQLVGNMVTDTDGQDTGGVRWFELRRTAGTLQPWQLYQEGTVAMGDFIDRWMGAIASDKVGNIALAYSAVRDASSHGLPESDNVSAGLRYIGRRDGDPAQVMTSGESILQQPASGSQSGNRWGDYHALNIDPVDGCTFWFTGEHVDATHVTASNWATRIGAFAHDNCNAPQFMLNSAQLRQSLCVTALPSTIAVSVDVLARNGFANAVDLAFDTVPAGMSGSFTPASLMPPAASNGSLTINDSALAAGSHVFNVIGRAGAISKQLQIRVDVANGHIDLIAPAMNAFVATTPMLTWSSLPGASGYQLQIATDAAFANIVYSTQAAASEHLVVAPLALNTTYYWRVAPQGVACGHGVFSGVRKFKTRIATATTLTTVSPSIYGETIEISALVVGDGLPPSGKITFRDGDDWITTLPLDSSGYASVLTNKLSSGTHDLSAVYAGDDANLGSVGLNTHLVLPGSVSIDVSDAPDPHPGDLPTTVTVNLQIIAPGSGTPTGSVLVTASNSAGCSIALPATSCDLVFATAGIQILSASYSGDSNFNTAVSSDFEHTSLSDVLLFSDSFEQ